jgi:hypothetical protein
VNVAAPVVFTIRHQLPHRLRLGLSQPFSSNRLAWAADFLADLYPSVLVRPSAKGWGFVLVSMASSEPLPLCPALAATLLNEALLAPPMQGPDVPPTEMELVLDRARQGSIKLLMVMAVAGWILPILPGTPFFLLAWWLGWRPDSQEAEPQLPLLQSSP